MNGRTAYSSRRTFVAGRRRMSTHWQLKKRLPAHTTMHFAKFRPESSSKENGGSGASCIDCRACWAGESTHFVDTLGHQDRIRKGLRRMPSIHERAADGHLAHATVSSARSVDGWLSDQGVRFLRRHCSAQGGKGVVTTLVRVFTGCPGHWGVGSHVNAIRAVRSQQSLSGLLTASLFHLWRIGIDNNWNDHFGERLTRRRKHPQTSHSSPEHRRSHRRFFPLIP
jgi:hypothetical protein